MRDNWLWEVFESSPVAFNIQDEDGVLVMVNAAYCTLTGRPRADLLGRSPRVFTHPEDILKNILMLEHLAAAEVGDPPLRLEKRYVHPDGTVRWGWVSLSRAVGPEGQRWTMAVVHDTTDRRGAEEALHDAAHTDALTGLVNRRGWRAGLRRLLAAAEPPAPLTLVMLDTGPHCSPCLSSRGISIPALGSLIVRVRVPPPRLTQRGDAPSLCERWQVRHVVAHVTMPARLTPEQFGAEMAVAAGDFTVLSNTVAARDASLPPADLVNALRSPLLREWQPPGGGAVAALSHAVIHSLDVTVALDRPVVAPKEAVIAVLDQLIAANGE